MYFSCKFFFATFLNILSIPEGISLALIFASCKCMKCSVTVELSPSLLVFYLN